MNILAINNLNPIKIFNDKKKNQSYPYFGISMQKPLEKDTVSFKADPTSKLLATRKGGASKATAIKVFAIADEAQKEITKCMVRLHRKYICTPENPKNLISEIGGRTKKPNSIREKSIIIEEDSIAGILRNMTDLNGTKEIIRDATRKDVHKALDIILEAIENGSFILEEVEVKRPKVSEKLKASEASKWDYADPEYLAEFVAKAEAIMDKKVEFPPPQLTKVNYTAIHFLFRFPGQKRVWEHQLMGYNVAKLKEIDDILFKVLNNKNVDKEYEPIVEILKPLILSPQEIDMLKYIKLKAKLDKLKFTPEEIEILKSRHYFENSFCVISDSPDFCEKTRKLMSKDIDESFLKLLLENDCYDIMLADTEAVKELKRKEQRLEKFNKYRADAFLHQREKRQSNRKFDHLEYFLPLKDDLPAELDLNNLYKIYLRCKSEISKKEEIIEKEQKAKLEQAQLKKEKRKKSKV